MAKERVPGRISRTLRTAWLSGRIGGSYLRAKLSAKKGDVHTANAKRIAATLGELRGPLMKVGQLLATHAKALPVEYAGLLAPLATSAPPMSFQAMRAVLEEDLGAPVESLFAEIGERAANAASLGQVHRGRLHDGTEVAIKVQYPGAEEAVRSDLGNMELATNAMKRILADTLGQTRFDATPIAAELAEHLLQETDYCREAYNAKLLARLFDGDPEIVVPRVYDSHSGLRVITYEWLEGTPLDAALADPARSERIVRQLVHALWHQFFHGGLLHADPHPGNFTVLPDGRLGLLDYGCVKIFDEAFMRAFVQMMHARLHGDADRLREAFVLLELMDDPESEEELEDMTKIADYFSIGMREDEEFDFGAFDYVAAGRELVLHFLARKRPPPAARHLIFLSRVLLGYYEYFSRAGAKLNFHRELMPYVERGFTGRTIEIPPYGE
jgi:predicted unusual protein kinase regulating ubiquinone biosynthesis (AarF/ABC1/UbiB family)